MKVSNNDFGRAFEYSFINELYKSIQKHCGVVLVKNTQYRTCKGSWDRVPKTVQKDLALSAKIAVDKLLKSEPYLCDSTSVDPIELLIQPDRRGELGDVRDVVAQRISVNWNVGFSLKHNHFAVKHSRLSPTIDFGEKWFGAPCSLEYWKAVNPIFSLLSANSGKSWSVLLDKEDGIYLPILNAFVNEVKRQAATSSGMPQRMVEYLLGRFDFYKIISVDDEQQVRIYAINIHHTLNKSSSKKKSTTTIPITKVPTRLVHIGIKPGSKTTVEMIFNEGWSFSFRIHNASSKVENSLKFDIQLIGIPASIFSMNCSWSDFG